MEAYLQCFGKKYEVQAFTLISDRQHPLNHVYTIVLDECAVEKQCAILKQLDKHFIIDMISQTSLKTKTDKDFTLLSPLKFYELHDGDEIKIGSQQFSFKITAEADSQLPLVPDSQDFDLPLKLDKSGHIEIPETQNLDSPSFLTSMWTNNNFCLSMNYLDKFKNEDEEDNEEYSDDMRLQMPSETEIESKVEQAPNRSENQTQIEFSFETQPIVHVPPRVTRLRKRKLEESKPKTRSINFLAASEDVLASYGQETQPILPVEKKVVTQKQKRIKVERNLEFEQEFIRRSQAKPKINPLLLSDEEDDDDDLSFGNFLKRKNDSSQTKNESASTLSIVEEEELPEIPSQILNNSDVLLRINESQHKSVVFDLDSDEEDEVKPAPVRKFFGSKTQQRRQLLKYGSSDDD